MDIRVVPQRSTVQRSELVLEKAFDFVEQVLLRDRPVVEQNTHEHLLWELFVDLVP